MDVRSIKCVKMKQIVWKAVQQFALQAQIMSGIYCTLSDLCKSVTLCSTMTFLLQYGLTWNLLLWTSAFYYCVTCCELRWSRQHVFPHSPSFNIDVLCVQDLHLPNIACNLTEMHFCVSRGEGSYLWWLLWCTCDNKRLQHAWAVKDLLSKQVGTRPQRMWCTCGIKPKSWAGKEAGLENNKPLCFARKHGNASFWKNIFESCHVTPREKTQIGTLCRPWPSPCLRVAVRRHFLLVLL